MDLHRDLVCLFLLLAPNTGCCLSLWISKDRNITFVEILYGLYTVLVTFYTPFYVTFKTTPGGRNLCFTKKETETERYVYLLKVTERRSNRMTSF